MTETFEHLPPHDIATEQAALGAAMMSADAAVTLVEKLTAVDFLRPAHQSIFAAIQSLTDRGEPVNAISVRLEMQHLRDGLEHVPDGIYLHSLMEQTPLVGGAAGYARDLQKLTSLRSLVGTGAALIHLGQRTAPEDADMAVESAQKLFDDATRMTTTSTACSAAELIDGFMEELEKGGDQRGVTTGWVDLDALLSRLRPGQLVTIGARPGMGKSAMMACLAHHVAIKERQPVFIGTLEMSTKEFMARMVAIDCKVPLDRLLEPKKLTEGDWDRLGMAHARFSEADTLIIDDEPGMGIAHLRNRLRSMRRLARPPALALVDYLQLMQGTGKAESRQVEVSGFSRSLKLMAKEYELPIVVGAQLNRDVERRADKRPMSSDLRESGGVEQDSDVVILLYRDDHYDKESPRSGEIDLIVDKNRSGPRGTITAAFQGHYSRVVDMAAEPWSPTKGIS